jgi:hypothetical protein
MLWVLSGYVPVAMMLGCFGLWASFRSKWRGVRPVKDKLLRAPGESLRIRIQVLDEDFIIALFALVGIAVLLGLGTAELRKKPSVFNDQLHHLLLSLWGFGLAAQFGCGWRMYSVLRKRMDYGLGFSGERAVGEELNKLMRDACFVFHDVPGENWNIDHVVIAPSGVFAVETKAKRKRKRDNAEFYKVTFDGHALHFPGWTETEALEQAERNAGWLCDLLSKALAEPIQVQPIVTLPGWFVDRKGKGPVVVLNHKEFRECIIRKGPAQLASKQMEQIAFQLEQKCRDVSF